MWAAATSPLRSDEMIGLDTNILVRYLTQDDPAQARAVDRFFAANADQRFFVSLPVLGELVWVLTSLYGYERHQVAAVVDVLLATKELTVEDTDAARSALGEYRSGSADYTDHLIGCHHRTAGCDCTATFDKKLLKEELFTSP